MRPISTTLLRNGLAVAAVVAAYIATSLSPALRERAQFFLFLTAVTASAWWGGWIPAILSATLSTVLANLFVMQPRGQFSLTTDHLERIAIFFAVAILISFLQTRRRRAELEVKATSDELTVARQIQQHLLPKCSPTVPGYDIAGISNPARMTGGDYFDYVWLVDGRLGIVIADVSGHGLGPAFLMAETRGYLRAMAQTLTDPGSILTICNRILCDDLESGRFITLFFGVLDQSSRQICYAAAGHDGTIVDARGKTTRLTEAGLPLGINYDEQYVTMGPLPLHGGEIVLLLTDGVTETRSANGELFGLERAVQVVHEHREKTTAEIVAALWRQSESFCKNVVRADDFSAIVLRVLSPNPAEPQIRNSKCEIRNKHKIRNPNDGNRNLNRDFFEF